jgi:hypothetical protein
VYAFLIPHACYTACLSYPSSINRSNPAPLSTVPLANSHSASQGILRTLWNPKVHYRVYNSPPLFPILSQMHPVHNLPLYFPKIHSNIIHPSTFMYSKWSLAFRFSSRNTISISQACYIPRPSHPPRIIFDTRRSTKRLYFIT